MTKSLGVSTSQVAWWSDPQSNPRAVNVDNLWNIQSSSIDVAWRQSFNTIFGSAITAKKIDEVLVKFDLWINLELSIPTEANGWTVWESNSRLLLSSSTAINWLTRLESKKAVRYRPWHEIFCYFTAWWLNWWIIWAVQNIGIFDAENGYFVWFNWIDFRITRRKDSVDNDILQANFNLDTIDWKGQSKFNLDTSKINIFRITFGYLWIAPAVFEVYAWVALGWLPFHTIDITNLSPELTIESPNLPITAEIIKSSWSEDIQMISWSWNWWFYNWGTTFAWDIPFAWNSWLWIWLTWTGNESVVALRLKSTFNWKTNKTRVKNINAIFKSTATSDIIKVQIIWNPTTIWGVDPNTLDYTDISTGRSTMEYAENEWVVVWGRILFTDYLMWWGLWSWAFAWGWEVSAEQLWLIWTPWDILTVTYQRVGSTWIYDALTSTNWLELF